MAEREKKKRHKINPRVQNLIRRQPLNTGREFRRTTLTTVKMAPVVPITPQIAHNYGCIDTGSIKGLIEASWKLGYEKSHGKIYSWIDSSAAFLKTAIFATIHLVTHVAFIVLGLVGVTFQNGRRFLNENLVRSLVDLSAIGIGVVGAVFPWAGYYATAKELDLLNRYVLKYDFIQESETKRWAFASPVFLLRYIYGYYQRSHKLSEEKWGGKQNLAKPA